MDRLTCGKEEWIMSVYRCYSQKKPGFDVEAQGLCKALQEQLGVKGLKGVTILNRYDADRIAPAVYEQAKGIVFSEPQVDVIYDETFPQPPSPVPFWRWRPCPDSLTSAPTPAPSASS